MSGRENVIKHLREIADYFRECRSNTSFGSKEEKYLWEFQNAAIEVSDLLKEQEAVEPTETLTQKGRRK